MARMTAKYTAALMIARNNTLPTDGAQDDLYQRLQEDWFFWNSKTKAWEKGQEPDLPTALIRIRVWADACQVERVAGDVIQALQRDGFSIVDKSLPYINRPPKQLEARVYLTFLRNEQ